MRSPRQATPAVAAPRGFLFPSTGHRAAVGRPTTGAVHELLADPHGRWRICVALAAPAVAFTAVPAMQFDNWQWLASILTAPVGIWGAKPFHRAALSDLQRAGPRGSTLVSAAVVAAFAWSLAALRLGDAGTSGFRDPVSLLAERSTSFEQIYVGVGAAIAVLALAGHLLRQETEPTPVATRFVAPYAAAVGVLAAGAFGFWLTAEGSATAASAALGVLVVACPVSIGLAGPLALRLGARRGAQLGSLPRRSPTRGPAAHGDAMILVPPDATTTEATALLEVAETERVVVPAHGLTATSADAVVELHRLGVHAGLPADEARRLLTHPYPEGSSPDRTVICGDPWAAVDTIRLGRSVRRTIAQNLILGSVFNVAALPVAALARLDPAVALGALALSAGCVALNSLRLCRFRSVRPPAHRRRR